MPHSAIVLLVAVLLDVLLPELPNAVHPVAWMGSAISFVRKHASTKGRWVPFAIGLVLMLFGVGTMVFLGWSIQTMAERLPAFAAIAIEALVLKSTFAIRSLVVAAWEVCRALAADDLAEARRLVSWHLVSRDTSSLDEPRLAAATIESLAENTSDSIVAPLFFYVVAGLPGALAYRFVNTSDAILGYRDEEREWLGKAPARLDDVANWIPARLTAMLMIIGGLCTGYRAGSSWQIWRRDHRLTASPNAGHPMSAAAGLLGVELEKVGHYRLNAGAPLPNGPDIISAIGLTVATATMAVPLYVVVLWLVYGVSYR
jgi:adenosylcobinamide-phosphate synthase